MMPAHNWLKRKKARALFQKHAEAGDIDRQRHQRAGKTHLLGQPPQRRIVEVQTARIQNLRFACHQRQTGEPRRHGLTEPEKP